ncbi:MAG: cyclopropane-fatty-acyl-phospholipid synthase family protein [Actinomycetota bacterium]|nr:cyclopropane-fatty-acyl-phospholipid synthase family protein [Actinomycetota bacterium]
MPDRTSEHFRLRLEEALPDRPFTLRFWDGGVVEATREGPTLTLRSPSAIGHVLKAPGELGIGRAYVTGEIDVDDLDAAIALLGRWSPGPLSLRTKAGLALAARRLAGGERPEPPAAELQPSRSTHSKERDAEAVRHHYDVANEFFALFLDESMTYSCALWEEGVETLEDAQRAKLDLICRKLELEPDQRMLDIGCGWGSLGLHAAREYNVRVLGITLSPPQAELANQRAREMGLSDLAEFRVADYRDLADDDFDAVASIGMVEHVGVSQGDEYASQIARVLKPGGKVLNHGIAWIPHEPTGGHLGADFSLRYVFPDAEVQNLSRMQLSLEKAGLETLHIENLHSDYAETLRHWAMRLDENIDEARRVAGEERLRVWRLYLRAARNGFETGLTGVYQMLCSHPIVEDPSGTPKGLRHSESRRRVPANPV